MNARVLLIGFLLAIGASVNIERGTWHLTSGTMLQADEGAAMAKAAEQKLFFEPTEAEATAFWQEIQAQDKLFRAAKSKGDVDEAIRLSLFHMTRAWVYNNAAYETYQAEGAWTDKAALLKAKELYEKALASVAEAEKSKHQEYSGEVKKVKIKAKRNLKTVQDQLEKVAETPAP